MQMTTEQPPPFSQLQTVIHVQETRVNVSIFQSVTPLYINILYWQLEANVFLTIFILFDEILEKASF